MRAVGEMPGLFMNPARNGVPVSEEYAVVCYGRELPEHTVSAVRSAVEQAGGTVTATADDGDARYSVHSLTVSCSGGVSALRAAVSRAPESGDAPVRAAVVPSALYGPGRKLLVMDVDSTLIKQEVIELLAAHAGKEAEVAAVTEAAMRGELDFAQSLHGRVAELAGLPESVISEVGARIELSDGAEALVDAFLAAGHAVAVVSGGFSQILEPLAARLKLTFSEANLLGVRDGYLTGKVEGAVVDRAAKEDALRRWARELDVPLERTIAVGDGANDLDMLSAAGLGVAFNAKPAVREAAHAAIDLPYLDVVRHFAKL
jgi:phosphoserine phosphatase